MKKIFFSRYLILIIVIGFFLFGCATAEYRMVRGECSSQAFQQYPVNNHIEVKTAFRQVKVATGQHCSPFGVMGNMHCTTQYSYEMQPYQKQVNVDSNAGARNQAIRSCTTSLCFSRYGNAKCKTAPVKPVSATPAPAMPAQ